MVDHAALARSFESAGAAYDRYRPGFPAAAVDAILPSPVGRALDLGAGTGKLTGLLLPRADEVLAVEPAESMLDILRSRFPEVGALSGTAERMPVGDESVDAVTVAQAFHWFDRERACAEIARVLKPGGTLGLLWNRFDPGCEWDRASHAIAHPAVDEQDRTAAAAVALPGFTFLDHRQVAWEERISRADYLARWGTVSSLLVADDETRAGMLRGIEEVLDAHIDTRGRSILDLPHVTDVFVYQRA